MTDRSTRRRWSGWAATRSYIAAGIAGLLLFSAAGTALSDTATPPDPADYLPELVLVPPGEMTVADPDRPRTQEARAEPRRVVFERPFRIGKFEVTFEQWDYCHQAGGCTQRPKDKGWGRVDRPVIDVSWDDIVQYLDWLSAATGDHYRLPNEDEWEYAARAGETPPPEPPPLFTDEALAWAADYSLAPGGR